MRTEAELLNVSRYFVQIYMYDSLSRVCVFRRVTLFGDKVSASSAKDDKQGGFDSLFCFDKSQFGFSEFNV